MAALFSVFVQIITVSLKKNERVVFLSLFLLHPGEEEVFDTRL